MTDGNDARSAGCPRLSVVISCFNYRAFVAEAIESVLGQDVPGVELIVVDDGSTDGSWEVIRGYGIAKAAQRPNGGALAACRYGLEQAEADFVLFLDADDRLAPGSLARILPHLEAGVAKLQFPLIPIDAAGRVIGPASPPLAAGFAGARLRREVIATGCYASPPTSGNVFRRDLCALLEEVDYERWVDGVMLFAAPFFGEVVSLPEPLGCYRLHERNGSQSGAAPEAARFAREAERFRKRHAHLRRILAARGVAELLVDADETFFVRERRLFGRVLEGARPGLGEVLALQRLLVGDARPIRQRLALALLFSVLLAAPRDLRRALLAYRLTPGRRSAWGFARATLRRLGLKPA
ncbi:MAG: glycosyltransferase [Caulobacteraceae bacterium]|nr:glycosyltransferase [Caulobacter sp.]